MRWAILFVVFVAGCVPYPPLVVNLNDGYTHIAHAGTFDCDGQPVAVDVSHEHVDLKHGCGQIWIAGWYNTVTVYVDPGATIDVTGNRNTIVYRLLHRGKAPQWTDRGYNNELLRNSLAAWEQDHDWYQELH
jgi:hypothetical protein